MKQTIFTLLVIFIIGLTSCRKDKFQATIQQFDQSQIQSYITSNGITGMMKDTAGGDTSGIYYKPIITGNGPLIGDTSNVAFVFTLRSFDGKYTSNDTIQINHYQGYVGHIAQTGLPYGLQLALINDMKYQGGSMRILIPSRLAYGLKGYGSGSTSASNTHIAGNQCLDYYVHVIGGNLSVKSQAAYQADYDDMVIQNYMKKQNLTGYIVVDTSFYKLYYKILKVGTGTEHLNQNSTFETTYTGSLLNNYVFDGANNGADSASIELPNLIPGVQKALSYTTSGGKISMIIPSGLGYGKAASTALAPNSILRFDFQIYSVTP